MAYIRIGTPIDKIGYFAFTRKAANEAKDRMLKKNPKYKKKQLKYFQTLHSLAFHSLGLREENVMQDYHYNDFGKELSIRVNAKKDADASPYLTCDNEYFQIILNFIWTLRKRCLNLMEKSNGNFNCYTDYFNYSLFFITFSRRYDRLDGKTTHI